jgi:hypothetical protein
MQIEWDPRSDQYEEGQNIASRLVAAHSGGSRTYQDELALMVREMVDDLDDMPDVAALATRALYLIEARAYLGSALVHYEAEQLGADPQEVMRAMESVMAHRASPHDGS